MSSEANIQEALLQFIYMAPIGLIKTDGDGQIELINPMAAQLMMPLLPNGELENLFDSLEQHLPELRQTSHDYHHATGTICDSLRFTLSSSSSTERHEPAAQILAISILKLDSNHLMACLSDVTKIALLEQERLFTSLKKAAHTDTLTELPNREATHEVLEALIEETSERPGSAFAVLLLNCDRFNRINSTYGQQVGDDLVKAIASRLVELSEFSFGAADRPSSKPIIARLGSDEFAIIIHHPVSCNAVLSEARLLADALLLPYQVSGHQIHISTSIGLGYHRTQEHFESGQLPTAKDVLLDVGIAMRDAKRAGGGRCHLFIAEMRTNAKKRGTLENKLRKALEQDELFVEYQPIIDLNTTANIGVEALVRWHSPELGVLPPFEFIGVAEETGLIVPLGLFVLRRACAQFAAWRLQSPNRAPSQLSVNLSRAQLLEDDLNDQIERILTDTGVPPACLQLEVTESLAAQSDDICERLASLKSLGIQIALDDFGTGYSSLSSLHQLPVDVVKIDRSFVSQICDSEHHRVLVQATVMVAKSLGMRTVAEGIETSCQAELLQSLLCDKGQGYLYSRPVPASAIPNWIQEWQSTKEENEPANSGAQPMRTPHNTPS